MPNGRCRNHGGASLVGPAHPSFRTGRHSKYLRASLGEKYDTALNDPHLLGLREDVALVDVRIAELIEAIGETGNTRLWREARTKLDAVKTAATKGKAGVGPAREALDALDQVLTDGLTQAATWDELADRLDLRRRLVDSETKRQKDLFEMISVERAHAMMARLVDVVKQHVHDPLVLTALSAEVRRMVTD